MIASEGRIGFPHFPWRDNRKELGELESRYREASGRLRPASTSIITYILVHEREAGLIGI